MRATGVRRRNLALEVADYPALSGFGASNDVFIRVGLDLAEEAIRGALDKAGLSPSDVDLVVSVSVTGIAAPSLDTRLVPRLGLRPDVKRLPVFGLGCVAGASGIARVRDYLAGDPDGVAVLLSVELCSLTLQLADISMPAVVGSGLFGDGAAAVVMVGAARAARMGITGPRGHRLSQPAVPGHRAHDGLGHRRHRLPARAVRRRGRTGLGAPRGRRRPLPRRTTT